ncbi:MAG: zf-HC2 domain-containing protein [Candidatus Neomarinimicrobiota bacterium]|jgi:anti-sigma factor RsiW|nr:zf-HC2 domain-containing protein [bacterium]
MDCYSFEKIISDYLDSNLTEKEQQAANAHLAECPDCQGCLQDMNNILSALHSLPQPSMNPGFEARLLACIEQQKAKKESPFIYVLHQYSRAISVAAAVFLLLATSLFVYSAFALPSAPGKLPAAEIRMSNAAPEIPAAAGSILAGSREENTVKDTSKTLPLNYQRHIMVVNE